MQLRLEGQVIREYHRPAPNQFGILDELQSCGWPPLIDDPLPFKPSRAKRRLRDAIHDLNQHLRLIRFHGNGDGTGIRWERLPDPPPGGGGDATSSRVPDDSARSQE